MHMCVQLVSPQRNVSLDLNDVQRVKVGDEQVGLSVGCSRGKLDQLVGRMQNAAGRCFRAYLPKESGRRLHLMSSVRLRLPYASTNTPNSAAGMALVNDTRERSGASRKTHRESRAGTPPSA